MWYWHLVEICTMDLSVRAIKVLEMAGVTNLGELSRVTPAEAYSFRNMGHSTMDEIDQAFTNFVGFHLWEDSEINF